MTTESSFTGLLAMVTESLVDWSSLTVTSAQKPTTPTEELTHLQVTVTGTSAEDDLTHLVDVAKRTFVEDCNFAMTAIVGPLICLFGMAGNLLSVVTWQRPGMGSSTGRYLTGQGVANFCFLLAFLLCHSLQHWCPGVKYSVTYGAFFSYFGFPMFYFTAICSIWITVGLTVDRCIMVCWITKAKTFCNEARATLALTLIAFLCFTINIPHFASFTPVYDHHHHQDGVGDNSSHSHQPQPAFTATTFTTSPGGQVFEFWVHCIFMILGPWIAVFFMNTMIIIKITTANKRMADKKSSQAMKKSKESENQITRLLLSVTFTFLVFMGMQCIVQCLAMQQPLGIDMMAVYASLPFSITGVLLNSSLNIVLYCLTGRRFRMELLKMLGLLKGDMLLPSSMDTSSSNTATTTCVTITATKTLTKGV